MVLGCGDEPVAETPPPAVSEVPNLVKQIETSKGLGRRAAISQIGRLGPAAKDALPQLKRIRGKLSAGDKEALDAAIAKIEGVAPAAGPPAS